MTITYDADGKCTRCGSTGYYLGSYTSDSSFEDIRTCIKSCPCHGWRPIWCLELEDGMAINNTLFLRSASPVCMWASASPCDATHWQPEPQPPEGV